jgi:RNA polymerase sigma factor (sigma-70 family)
MTDVGPPSLSEAASTDAALEEAVRRHLPLVYAAARRQLPDASLAEDVTQAVFMVLARRHRELPTNVVLSSWLLKVTHLACLQARRNAGRRREHERKAAQMRPAVMEAEPMPQGLLSAEVDSALAGLGEADRDVLTLRYLEELSVAEVGRRLGISEEAAQKRVDRAIARLRKKMGVSPEQLGAEHLSAFFVMQNQLQVPAQLAGKVSHALATAGSAAAPASAAALSQAVLKTLSWSAAKVPLLAALITLALTVGAVVVQQALSRHGGTPQASTVRNRNGTPADHGQAASTNVPGADYPRVDDQRRATFRLFAPNARTVSVQVAGGFDMSRGDDGFWSVTTATLVPGFHYYHFLVDGAQVADPGSRSFFGVSRMLSGLEVPEAGVDFYHVKDVPHGEVRARYYRSSITQSTRQAFVYTPPGYDGKPRQRYPVLYLLAGIGEDQRAWAEQGRIGEIMDNLIARGAAEEMIVVMEDAGTAAGYAPRGAGGRRQGRGRGDARAAFAQVFISETIPMIDATYRTIPERGHRAMAGTSQGAAQTLQITQDRLDLFAYVGSFSAVIGYPAVPSGYGGLLGDPDEFAKRVRVLYVSSGGTENNSGAREFHDQLEAAGVAHVYYEAPGNGHGWHAWRKSLHGFAQLLFKD